VNLPAPEPAPVTRPSEVPFPFRELLGFEIEKGEGIGVARLVVAERHLNPNGAVHGAVPYALIDTAMGAATMSVLDAGLMCATIEIHTRYLAPCFGGQLTATATVRKAGRRIVHLDATVSDDGGNEIVAASGSFAVLTPPSGASR
jgi:acyl-CoA thioesterase